MSSSGEPPPQTPEIEGGETALEQSRDLVRIVSVVYGVALTQVVVLKPTVILHPVASTHSPTALAIFSAAWFAAYGFFSYVLSLGLPKNSYNIYWPNDAKVDHAADRTRRRDTIRFGVDLLLAGAYAWLLVAAATLTPTGTHSQHPPSLGKVVTYLCGFALVLAIACCVRLLRYAPDAWRQATKNGKNPCARFRAGTKSLLALVAVPGAALLVVGAGIWIVYWQQPLSLGSVRLVSFATFGLTIAYSIVSVINSHKRRLAQLSEPAD